MTVPSLSGATSAASRPISRLADHQADLSRLLPLWPHEAADQTPQGRRRRIALLERALRAERRRGIAGHWTYDLARHSALLRCYRRERDALALAPTGA